MDCPTCNGTGEVDVEIDGMEMPDECHDCNGMGILPNELAAYGNDCKGGCET